MTDSWIGPSKIFVTDGNYVFFGKLSNSVKLFHEFGQDWNIKESYIPYEIIDNQEFEEQPMEIFSIQNIFTIIRFLSTKIKN